MNAKSFYIKSSIIALLSFSISFVIFLLQDTPDADIIIGAVNIILMGLGVYWGRIIAHGLFSRYLNMGNCTLIVISYFLPFIIFMESYLGASIITLSSMIASAVVESFVLFNKDLNKLLYKNTKIN